MIIPPTYATHKEDFFMENQEEYDYYTLENLNSTIFYQLPKAFFHNPLYIKMKSDSKIAYSILRDLLPLSAQNNWINEQGRIYVKLARKKMMKYLNIKGEQKITQIMKELKDKKLINEVQIGVNKCNEIYICRPKELNIIYSDAELLELETVENTLTFENQSSRTVKIKGQELRKSKVKNFENQRHINTNYNKTKKTNTNSNYYKKENKFVDNCSSREYTSEDFENIENKLLGWDK
jgi:hypothetical protein